MLVGAHGAYLNGWRNASPGFAPGGDAEDEQALIWANAMTGVADDLLRPHRSPSDDAEGDLASSPVGSPVSKPRVLDGGDVRRRRAGCVPSPHHRPHHGGPTWQSWPTGQRTPQRSAHSRSRLPS